MTELPLPASVVLATLYLAADELARVAPDTPATRLVHAELARFERGLAVEPAPAAAHDRTPCPSPRAATTATG